VDGHNFEDHFKPGELRFEDEGARLFWLGNHTVPCLGFESEGASKVYIYCHANHDDMWRCSGMLRLVATTLKCHVVTFEYPGYGCAPGSANSENTVDSLHRLYDHLIHDRGFLPRDLMLMGRSIGSAIAVQFAAKYPVGVLILLTPFTSILDIVRHGEGSTGLQLLGHVLASVSPDMFRSIDTIQNMETPLLVIGGEEDLVTPVEHSRNLFEAAKHCLPKRLECVQAMAHNNVYDEPFCDQVLHAVKSFVDDEVDVDWLKLSSPRPLFEPTSDSDDDFTTFLSPRHQRKQTTPLVQNTQDAPSKPTSDSDGDSDDDFTAFLSPRHQHKQATPLVQNTQDASRKPTSDSDGDSDDDFTAFLSPRHQRKQATPLVQNTQDASHKPTSDSDDDFTAFLSPRHQRNQATPLVQNTQDAPNKASSSEDIQLDVG